MGMYRDASETGIDIVKEMAEGLGSTGLQLEDLLIKTEEARRRAQDLLHLYGAGASSMERPEMSVVNESIRDFNTLVERAEDTLRWLLIQREACGFRTHRNVHKHYPIPSKIRPLE